MYSISIIADREREINRYTIKVRSRLAINVER